MYKEICLLLLFFLGLLYINVWAQENTQSSINPSCRDRNCSCCLETANCNISVGQCDDQCIQGFHGGRCKNNCPSRCLSCIDAYPSSTNTSLWSIAKCIECKPGYFSTSDLFQCQFNCSDATNCPSCMTGYYQLETGCSQCPSKCASCTTFNQCNQCNVGFYISVDVGYGNCTPCSEGCSNKLCDNRSGVCNCTSTIYTGDKCDQCAPNFQTYPDCKKCMAGFYGTDCRQDCPVNCNGTVCDMQSGHCANGCNENFTGVNCTFCIAGLHGHNCDKKCPVNCYGGVCNQSNGYCLSCKSNFTGETCDSCINGQYGINCDFFCPSNCNESLCDRTTGNCDSCINGHTGDKCCIKGNDCQSCLSDSVCSECVPGKHGDQCGKTCPERCANTICYKLNGTCISCVAGFHGDTCTIASTGPGVPVAAVAGGVIGGLVVIIIGIVLLIFFKRRSSHKNENTKFMAHPDVSTRERVYANDAAVTDASKQFNTLDTVANTYDTVTDMVPEPFGASWKNSEATPITTERPNATIKLDESVKSDKAIKLDKSVKHDKQVKPEMAGNPVKPIKTAKSSKTTLSTVPRVDNKPGYESLEDEDDNDYYNSEASTENGIPVSGLSSYVDKKDSDSFNNEYAKLPKGLVKSTDVALLDQNLSKNRYNAIYPYDETRVVLAGPGSDFINACYIEGYRKKRRYIASLAPKGFTAVLLLNKASKDHVTFTLQINNNMADTSDSPGPIAKATEGFKTFWRMVWQEKTEKIVMVTNLMETGGMKCEQYWPDKNVTLAYGDVKVTCHSEDVYAEYTVRSFTVRKKKEQRSLHHIHYTAWPDKGVPDDVTSLVEFRNKVNSTKTTLRRPIIVHCSAGVGRTGTYIALDILTLKGERTGFVNIFECVSKLRQQRTCMVQTAEQYEYLHRALVHTLTFESEAIPADHFMAYTASLRDDIFDRLSHCTEKISTEEMEAIDRNKAYAGHNRPGADIPGDNNRPRLYYGRTTEYNDYINALFVNSFKRKNQFILTQTPLPNTVDDFLTLVVQENCCCIVSMDAADLVDKTIGTYLPPDNQTLTTDTYEVRIKKLDSNHIFCQSTLTITSKNKSSTVTVQHFRCTNWSDKDKTPKSPSELLTLVKQIQKVADETTQFSPIIIHCRTGSERSALPCVVLSLLQKIEIEHEVSVINTVRQVKVRRSKSIPNKSERDWQSKETCRVTTTGRVTGPDRVTTTGRVTGPGRVTTTGRVTGPGRVTETGRVKETGIVKRLAE